MTSQYAACEIGIFEGYGECDDLATPSSAMAEYARNVGDQVSEREWILTDYDVWVKNPHYCGSPGRHPEDDHED